MGNPLRMRSWGRTTRVRRGSSTVRTATTYAAAVLRLARTLTAPSRSPTCWQGHTCSSPGIPTSCRTIASSSLSRALAKRASPRSRLRGVPGSRVVSSFLMGDLIEQRRLLFGRRCHEAQRPKDRSPSSKRTMQIKLIGRGRRAKTDDDGRYEVPALPPGRYHVEIYQRDGASVPWQGNVITLSARQVERVDF